MGDQILVVKMSTVVSGERINKIYKSILEQMKTGVVVLPNGCEPVLIPKDIEVQIENGENKNG